MSRMCGGICIIFFGCCLLSAITHRQQMKKKNSKLPALFNALLRNVKDKTGKNSI